jgi:hypothetical protein
MSFGQRKTRGAFIIKDPALPCDQIVETFTCLHCQAVVDKPPFKSNTDDGIGGYCHKCNGPVCLKCAGKPCVPIERWLETMETKMHYDGVLGRK